jgi:hypothetical protein
MTSLVERFRAAKRWSRARALCSARRYAEALALLREYEGPARRSYPWRLFEVYNLSLLDDYVGTLQSATALIDDLSKQREQTPNDAYFLAFARWCAWFAFAKLFPQTPLPEKFRVDPAAVSRQGVKPRWQRTFPLPSSP